MALSGLNPRSISEDGKNSAKTRIREEYSTVLLLICVFIAVFSLPFSFLPDIDAQLLRYLFVTTIAVLALGRMGIPFRLFPRRIVHWLIASAVVTSGCVFVIWSLVEVEGFPVADLGPVVFLYAFIFLGVAINEEVFVRGVIQTLLDRATTRWRTIITTAFIFAGLHLSTIVLTGGFAPIWAAYLFGLGLLLSYLYQKTGSLLLSIAVHGASDCFAYNTVLNAFTLPPTDPGSVVTFSAFLILPIVVVSIRGHVPTKPLRMTA